MPLRRLPAWFALAPLPAIGLGAFLAARVDVSPLAFAPNGVAAALGLGACWALARRPRAALTAAGVAPWLALAAIAATLLGPAIDGVHRWLPLGPLRLNASEAFAPWLLLGFAGPALAVRERTAAVVLAAQLLHLAQPDAAQATALALGAAPLLVSRQVVRAGVGFPALLAVLGAAALAWLRPDHLAPVPHVEGILALARDQGAVTAAAALFALALALLPLGWPAVRRDRDGRALGAAAALYLCGSIAATGFGAFPVPLLGAGAATVLGWYGLFSLVPRETNRSAPP